MRSTIKSERFIQRKVTLEHILSLDKSLIERVKNGVVILLSSPVIRRSLLNQLENEFFIATKNEIIARLTSAERLRIIELIQIAQKESCLKENLKTSQAICS